MAALIPAIGTCVSNMTGGERRLANRLEQKLEDDWLLDAIQPPRKIVPSPIFPMEIPLEEFSMFIDAPPDHVETPAFYVAAKDQTFQTAKNNLPNKLGVCNEYRTNDTHPVSPIFDAKQYYLEFNKGPAVVAKVYDNLQIRTETQIEVAKQPVHGRLELFMPNATAADGISKYDYHYIPEKDYVGLDNFEFRVSVDGESLSVFYQVIVFPEDENPNYIGYCNWEKPIWKISTPTKSEWSPISRPVSSENQRGWSEFINLFTLTHLAASQLTASI